MSQEPISGSAPINNPDGHLHRGDPSEIVSDPRKAKEFKEKIEKREQTFTEEESEELTSTEQSSTKGVESDLDLELQTLNLNMLSGTAAEEMADEIATSMQTAAQDLEAAQEEVTTGLTQNLKIDPDELEAALSLGEAATTATTTQAEQAIGDELLKQHQEGQMTKEEAAVQKEANTFVQQTTTHTSQSLKKSIFDLEADKQVIKNADGIQKESATSRPQLSSTPQFADIPVILNVSMEVVIEVSSSQIDGVSASKTIEPVRDIANVVLKAAETLAVRQVGGTTEVSITLARNEVPTEFAGANLVVSQKNNRIEISFDNFMSKEMMQQAEGMIRSNLEILLASLSTKNIGVEQIMVGGQNLQLPEQYVAHLASMQTNMTLEELMFGKRHNKDSSDSLDSFKRSQQGSTSANIDNLEGHQNL